jgi:ATP-dependent exoDNAse (exonuclease V) alpha subunit
MTSINRFKGCEAEVVILILKGSLLPITEKQIRYTQMSRARGMLCILEKGKGQNLQEDKD